MTTTKIDPESLVSMEVKCQVWELPSTWHPRNTTGFEQYVTSATTGIVLFYDVTNQNSFSHLNDWFELIQHDLAHMKLLGILVLGTKVDLENTIPETDVLTMCKKWEKKLNIAISSSIISNFPNSKENKHPLDVFKDFIKALSKSFSKTSDSTSDPFLFKILTLGDSNTGKTSFINKIRPITPEWESGFISVSWIALEFDNKIL